MESVIGRKGGFLSAGAATALFFLALCSLGAHVSKGDSRHSVDLDKGVLDMGALTASEHGGDVIGVVRHAMHSENGRLFRRQLRAVEDAEKYALIIFASVAVPYVKDRGLGGLREGACEDTSLCEFYGVLIYENDKGYGVIEQMRVSDAATGGLSAARKVSGIDVSYRRRQGEGASERELFSGLRRVLESKEGDVEMIRVLNSTDAVFAQVVKCQAGGRQWVYSAINDDIFDEHVNNANDDRGFHVKEGVRDLWKQMDDIVDDDRN